MFTSKDISVEVEGLLAEDDSSHSLCIKSIKTCEGWDVSQANLRYHAGFGLLPMMLG